MIALRVLQRGGVVFGAAFDQDFFVKHIMVDKVENLDQLKGSKYVQSRIGNAYIQVKECLENDKYVLFSGTPCQVGGLRKFLGKEYENLLTVDLICHGVPSPGILKNYLDRKKREDNNLQGMVFRDKVNGWKNVTVSYDYGDRKEFVRAVDDEFFYGFDRNYFLRPSC